MPELKSIRNKGMVLFIVLATILFVVLLANIILSVVSSQSRLTHHQVSRIQAYYAAKAGMNWALEMLRLGQTAGGWPQPAATGSDVYRICRANPCPDTGTACNLANKCTVDASFPVAVQSVVVTVSGKDVAGCRPPGDVPLCVNSAVNYTYQQ